MSDGVAESMAEAVLIAVCSASRRASTQSVRGNQWWARDVYHISDGHNFTLCGRAHHDWLIIGPIEPDINCCKRCAAKISSLPASERTAHDQS